MPTINYDSRVKNPIGGFFSLIIFVVSSLFALVLSVDTYARDTPFTSAAEQQFDASDVNLRQFPIAFALIDAWGNDLSIDDEFMKSIYMSANLWIVPKEYDPEEENVSRYEYPIVECSEKYMDPTDYQSIHSVSQGRRKFCFDFDNPTLNGQKVSKEPVVRNEYGNYDSAFFYFYIERCVVDGVRCSDYRVPYDVFYIKLYSQKKYLNSNDYHDPIKVTPDSRTVPVSYSRSKREFIDINMTELITDHGWFLISNSADIWYYQGGPKETSDMQTDENTLMYGFTYSSPRFRKYHYRRYVKIQDLCAQVFGFMKGLMLMSNLVVYPVSSFIFYKRMWEEVYLLDKLYDSQRTERCIKYEQKEGVQVTKDSNIDESITQISIPSPVGFFSFFFSEESASQVKEVSKYLEVPYICKTLIELQNEVRYLRDIS